MAVDPIGNGTPLDDPLAIRPPKALEVRTAFVQAQAPGGDPVMNTIRLPNDPKHPEKDRWYVTGKPGLFWAPGKDTGNEMPPVQEGNEVQFFVDAIDRPDPENTQPNGSHTARTYKSMVEAIQTANSEDKSHFIYLLNWWYQDDYRIDGASTMADLLKAAAMNNIEIRALFWFQKGFNVQTILHFLGPVLLGLLLIPGAGLIIAGAVLAALLVMAGFGKAQAQNQKGVDNINALTSKDNRHPASAILDNNLLNFGSHHQKVLVVNGSDGLIAFCGGIDFNPDRRFAQGEFDGVEGAGSPLHDAHVRIVGPAAVDLLRLFVQRWKDHPDVEALPEDRRGLKGEAALSQPQPSKGEQMVQIARTFGNGSKHDGIARGGYSFAPQGERTASMLIAHAIQSAKRFIYIEDQYFTNKNLLTVLLQALPNIEHLTILMPHASLSDQPDGPFHRHQIITKLRETGGEKVRVFCRANPAPGASDDDTHHIAVRNGANFDGAVHHAYIHSKLVIVDDRFACVGSANCNSRGWTHDSEVTAGIFDESHDDTLALHFAHRLRIKMWAEHLKMDTPAGHAELWDGVASAVHWDRLPPASRVIRYDKSNNAKPADPFNIPPDFAFHSARYHLPVPLLHFALDPVLVNTGFFFDTFVDPDGS